MPRKRNLVPSYRLHRQSGQAVCEYYDPLTGIKKSLCLGKFGTAESRAEHARVVAEVAAGVSRAPRDGISLSELFVAFLQHAKQYYRKPNGTQTSEFDKYKDIIRLARETHGEVLAVEFGPIMLKTIRQRMINMAWCRKEINIKVGRLRRIFKWAASEELVPVSVFEALRTVSGLQEGRSKARETDPILPVPHEDYEATLPHLPHMTRDCRVHALDRLPTR